jgi:hypothetical protein
MTDIWQCCLYQGGTLNVLLAMADIADDDGGDIFPGIEYLSAKVRQSPRATHDCIKRLRSDGVVRLVGPDGEDLGADKKPTGGRGHRTEYRIDLERVQELQGLHEAGEPDCVHCKPRLNERARARQRVKKRAEKDANSGRKRAVSDGKTAKSCAHIEEPLEPSNNLSATDGARASNGAPSIMPLEPYRAALAQVLDQKVYDAWFAGAELWRDAHGVVLTVDGPFRCERIAGRYLPYLERVIGEPVRVMLRGDLV